MTIALLLLASSLAHAAAWQPPAGLTQQPLWPGTPPDQIAVSSPEFTGLSEEPVGGRRWEWAQAVSTPTLTVYPAKGKSTGAAVLVFPGGGYQVLAMDLEGTEVCDWLTSKGVACAVLKYRVAGVMDYPKGSPYPRSGPYPFSPIALEDAQRAMGMLRLRAKEYGIDPKKLGVLGFSAGGHLVGAISTHYDRRLYPKVDAADDESCRPDFAILAYPGHLTLSHLRGDAHRGGDARKIKGTPLVPGLNPDLKVTKDTPPAFLVASSADPVDNPDNSLIYFQALRKAGVPAELHLFAKGGHAFGLRRTDNPITEWTDLAERWLRVLGFL